MACISKKTVKGKVYYYYIENKRINGKVKTTQQIYLGSADRILELCEKNKKAQHIDKKNKKKKTLVETKKKI
jgi:hypothetical protein